MKSDSKFRAWIKRIWIENTEERLTFNEKSYTIKEYWDRYKYWLKREYRYQQKNES